MTLRGAALRGAVLAALLVGTFWAGRFFAPDVQALRLICRPSAPTLAGGQSVLLFGNSQLYDGDWHFPGALAVNCARQGLTLRAGLALMPDLPPITPDAIIIAFGAVEVLQAAARNAVPDDAAFAQDMTALLAHLRARWPDAILIVSAVPPMRPNLLPPRLQDAARINGINAAIMRAATGAVQVNPADALAMDAGGLAPTMTYDGVHLTPLAYELWQAQIIAAAGLPRPQPPLALQ
jgi:lysophospholipase L1-like esterase